MKKTGPILALAATALLTPHAMADTLDNVRQSISGTIPLETGAGEENSGVYLRVNTAANFLDGGTSGVKIQGIPLNPNLVTGIQNGKISYHTGMALNLGLGIPLTPNLAVEISSGFAYNPVDDVTGTWLSGPASSDTISGGDGNTYQVPLVAELAFSIYDNNTLQVNLRGGIGVQWTFMDINNFYASSAPASKASLTGDALTFRYQFGIEALIKVAPNISVGATLGYSGTTDSDFGEDAFSPNAGLAGEPAVKTDEFQNITLRIGLKIEF